MKFQDDIFINSLNYIRVLSVSFEILPIHDISNRHIPAVRVVPTAVARDNALHSFPCNNRDTNGGERLDITMVTAGDDGAPRVRIIFYI